MPKDKTAVAVSYPLFGGAEQNVRVLPAGTRSFLTPTETAVYLTDKPMQTNFAVGKVFTKDGDEVVANISIKLSIKDPLKAYTTNSTDLNSISEEIRAMAIASLVKGVSANSSAVLKANEEDVIKQYNKGFKAEVGKLRRQWYRG